jgi:hypothetical protein
MRGLAGRQTYNNASDLGRKAPGATGTDWNSLEVA